MILAGVPFDAPRKFVALDGRTTIETADNTAQIVKPHKPEIGNVTLKIDVSKLGISAIEALSAALRKFLIVQFVGGDTLYATGEVSHKQYNIIWSTIDLFQCNVIC